MSRLFPLQSPERLAQLSRQQLLCLLQGLPITQEDTPDQSLAAQDSDGDDEREWNEPDEIRDPSRAVCDDVNGLSLSVYRRSYMGISSIHAVLRTMFRLRPSLKLQLKNQLSAFRGGEQNERNRPYTWAAFSPSELELRDATPALDEETCIDAYFAHVHGIVPFLDEAEFRDTWRRRERRDRPWHALLNMVLVLGSLSIGDANESSRTYYARAKMYIDLELLGSGCLDTLRALCLLGGLYLHYKNAPNMAYTIMGVAYRIAIGLGLHHQPVNVLPAQYKHAEGARRSRIRRQIWWTLFCLDTWGSMTLGRPTMGRWDPETMEVPAAGYLQKSDPFVETLDCSRKFCMIATRVQHRFAQHPPIKPLEIARFDGEVLEWYYGLPPELTRLEECPARLKSALYIMRNRYLNLRLLLHRPVLLRYADAEASTDSLPTGDRESIQHCRRLAHEAIDCVIMSTYGVDYIRAWSGVWYLYQASLVLLLSMLVDVGHVETIQWKMSVEKAVSFFDLARPWSLAAGRSSQVVKGLLDAITNSAAVTDIAPTTGTLVSSITSEFGVEDESWSSLGGQRGQDISPWQDWDWDVLNYQLEPDLHWFGTI